MNRTAMLIVGGLLVAACGKPFWKAPPPPPEPVFPARLLTAEIDSITLVQTPCMAPCATYSYVLRRNGTAGYEGYRHTPMLGRYAAPISRAAFDSLVAVLRAQHFLQMARRYEYRATDHRSTITRVFLADTVKEVHRYGPAPDAPRELYQVEAAVESVGARLPWQYLGPGPSKPPEEM